MKIQMYFLVARLKANNEVVMAIPIRDPYDQISIAISSEYLTDEDIARYYEDTYSGDMLDLQVKQVFDLGYLYDEQEPKDLVADFSIISIKIEEKEIDIN